MQIIVVGGGAATAPPLSANELEMPLAAAPAAATVFELTPTMTLYEPPLPLGIFAS